MLANEDGAVLSYCLRRRDRKQRYRNCMKGVAGRTIIKVNTTRQVSRLFIIIYVLYTVDIVERY